jgi:hypothetical protein
MPLRYLWLVFWGIQWYRSGHKKMRLPTMGTPKWGHPFDQLLLVIRLDYSYYI